MQDTVVGLPQFCVRQGIGKDTEEGFVGFLTVDPVERVLVNEVGSVLRSIFIVGVSRRYVAVLDILLQCIHNDVLVAILFGVVAIEEVGLVGVCLELANRTVVAVDAALVGQ